MGDDAASQRLWFLVGKRTNWFRRSYMYVWATDRLTGRSHLKKRDKKGFRQLSTVSA